MRPLAWRDFQRQRRGFTRAGVVALSGLGSLCAAGPAVILFSTTRPFLPVGESLHVCGHVDRRAARMYWSTERAPAGMHWAEVVLTVSSTLLTAVIYAC